MLEYMENELLNHQWNGGTVYKIREIWHHGGEMLLNQTVDPQEIQKLFHQLTANNHGRLKEVRLEEHIGIKEIHDHPDPKIVPEELIVHYIEKFETVRDNGGK